MAPYSLCCKMTSLGFDPSLPLLPSCRGKINNQRAQTHSRWLARPCSYAQGREGGGETGKGGGIYDGGRLFGVLRTLVQLCRLLAQDGDQEGHLRIVSQDWEISEVIISDVMQ